MKSIPKPKPSRSNLFTGLTDCNYTSIYNWDLLIDMDTSGYYKVGLGIYTQLYQNCPPGTLHAGFYAEDEEGNRKSLAEIVKHKKVAVMI